MCIYRYTYVSINTYACIHTHINGYIDRYLSIDISIDIDVYILPDGMYKISS